MNKRQKKKQVKKAMDNLESGKLTKKDKQVLLTYGRYEFISKYHHPPEILNLDFKKVYAETTRIWNEIKKSMQTLLFEIGKTFIRMSGKEDKDAETVLGEHESNNRRDQVRFEGGGGLLSAPEDPEEIRDHLRL